MLLTGSDWEQTQRCLDTLNPSLDPARDKLVALESGQGPPVDSGRLTLYTWVTRSSDESDRAAPGTSRVPALNRAITGLGLHEGDLVIVMDDHTLLPAPSLNRLVAAVSSGDWHAAAPYFPRGSTLLHFDETDPGSLAAIWRNWSAARQSRVLPAERLRPYCLVFTAELLLASRPLDERFIRVDSALEDLVQRAATTAGSIGVVHGALAYHRPVYDWKPGPDLQPAASDLSLRGPKPGAVPPGLGAGDSGSTALPSGDPSGSALAADSALFVAIHGRPPVSATTQLISACLITKNEEANLPRCLDALYGFVDEVVIYDTGSTDRTIGLARAREASVFEGYWDDDFSRARNAALAHCGGEWILWVDADEEVVLTDRPAEVRSIIASSPPAIEGYLIHIDNLEGSGTTSVLTHPAARLFRSERCHWSGRLHEQITLREATAGRAPILVEFPKVRLTHYGYLDTLVKERDKGGRNVRIAEKELEDRSERDRTYMQTSLARSVSMEGDLDRALALSRDAARSATDPTTRRLALRTSAATLAAMGRMDEALEEVNELRLASGNPVTADMIEVGMLLAIGEGEAALAVAETLIARGRQVDDDMFEYKPEQFLGARAAALRLLERHGEAADCLLETLRNGEFLDAHMGDLLGDLHKAGRSVAEIATALPASKLVGFMGQVRQLPPEEADEILEACYNRFQRSSRSLRVVLAAASKTAEELPIARTLEWAARVRRFGVPAGDPLLALATNVSRPLPDRALAAATCCRAFGDPDAVLSLRRVVSASRRVGGGVAAEVLELVKQISPGTLARSRLEASAVVYVTQDAGGTGRTEALLDGLLDAVADGRIEIIVVDDSRAATPGGEPDIGTAGPVGLRDGRESPEYAAGSVRVHRTDRHLGIAGGLRAGTELARAEYVVLLINRSQVTDSGLARLIETLDRDDSTPAVAFPTGAAGADDGASKDNGLATVGGGTPGDGPTSDSPACTVGIIARKGALIETWDTSTPPRAATGSTETHRTTPSGGRTPQIGQPSSTERGLLSGIHVHLFESTAKATSGLARGGRLLLEALQSSGASVEPARYRDAKGRLAPERPGLPAGTRFHADMIAVDLIEVARAISSGDPLPGCPDGYRIASWHWEVDALPPHLVAAMDLVDEVWVHSEFERLAFARASRGRVRVEIFPYAVASDGTANRYSRAALGLPEGFIFLTMFDFASTIARKNPEGAIRAFARAFSPGEGPTLVVKANDRHSPADFRKLAEAVGGRDDIVLIVEEWSRALVEALLESADCYVSLHRSEGFGLPIAEAMALGKPVIATAYSGNLDFMDPDNSYLVPCGFSTIPRATGPYPEGFIWAEPNLAAAADLMRHAWSDQDSAAAKGGRARNTIRRRYSAERATAFVRARLAAIANTPQGSAARSHADREHRSRRGIRLADLYSAGTEASKPAIHAGHSPGTGTGTGTGTGGAGTIHRTRSGDLPEGVDIIGPGTSTRGYPALFGIVANLLASAGYPYCEADGSPILKHDTVVLFRDPDSLANIAMQWGSDFFERYVICCFDWPLTVLPDPLARGLRYTNEIWVPSPNARVAVETAGAGKPVIELSIPPDAAIAILAAVSPGREFGALGADIPATPLVAWDEGGFLLTVVDGSDSFQRSNPIGVVEAFTKAFPGSDGPRLVVMTTRSPLRRDDRKTLTEATVDRDDIDVTGPHNLSEVGNALRNCSAYISLHRAIGYDLPLAAAVALGKPVISTASPRVPPWLATDSGTVTLIPYDESTVPAGCWPYPEGAPWSDPDAAAAAALADFYSRCGQPDRVPERSGAHTGSPPLSSTAAAPTSPLPLPDLISSRLRFAHGTYLRARHLLAGGR